MKIPSPPISIEGTLDLVTPPEVMPPGRLIAAKNYEPCMRGARRFSGYERYDGHPKPSDASYWRLDFDAGSAAIAEGDTVTGLTSSATGKALLNAVVETGSYGGANAAGYLILTGVSGTFQDNEPLQVLGVTKSTSASTAAQRGAGTDALDTTYYRDAIETARALIQKPTGSGGILGVWKFKGIRYCFRDNVGGTATAMFKATSTGWSEVDLGRRVAFTSGGTYEILEGDVVTGATSAATATVRRVNLTSGTWGGGDAAGYLVLYGQTGTFQAENLDISGHANSCTIAGNSAAQTLAAAGKYRFLTHNFYGASNLVRMFGVNGVNEAFNFDGTYFALTATGMAVDKPTHNAVFKNQLVLGFRGGSIQTTSIGEPDTISVLSGASEIGIGADVTNLMSGWADSLVITGRSMLKILYGNDSEDFNLDDTNDYAGAYADTMQLVGLPIYMDDTGIRNLTPSESVYGNFNLGTLSRLVEPYFEAKRTAGASPVSSVVCKRKDQYRLFFDDNTALFVFFGRRTRSREPWILPLTFDVAVMCACSTVCATGDDANEEVVLFGGDDGYVYEMDVGTSFDGEELEAYARLPFNNLGSPTRNKKWFSATLAVDAQPLASLVGSAEFSGGDADQPPVAEQTASVYGGGGTWNVDNWDQFYWSSPTIGRATIPIEGVGTDVSLAILSVATYEMPHTLHGVTYHYANRGLKR